MGAPQFLLAESSIWEIDEGTFSLLLDALFWMVRVSETRKQNRVFHNSNGGSAFFFKWGRNQPVVFSWPARKSRLLTAHI